MKTNPQSIDLGIRHHQEPVVGWIITSVVGVIGLLAMPVIVLYLFLAGAGVLMGEQAWTLFTLEWRPGAGMFGIVPLIAGTLSTSFFALLLAVPLGLGTVINLHFFSGPRVQHIGEAALGILGGTPSVVFGLFCTVWIVPRLGPSLASGTLVLTAMILPTFALMALAAMRQLPKDMITAGSALGLSREQIVWHLALKTIWPLLAAAATLALSRGLGEALAVEMVCGNVPGIPTSFLQPVRTLTTAIVQEFEYARGAHNQALHLVALTVVLLSAAASTLALRLNAQKVRM